MATVPQNMKANVRPRSQAGLTVKELLKVPAVQEQINEQLIGLNPSEPNLSVTVEYHGVKYRLPIHPLKYKRG